jgi:hypothetical protein
MPCSDARSNLACAFPETAVVALLILRRVTWTLDTLFRWPPGAPVRFIGAKRPSPRGVTCPQPSSPPRAQPKCGKTAGFSALATSEDRGSGPSGTRHWHFALLRPLKPVMHSRFPCDERAFFSGTRAP